MDKSWHSLINMIPEGICLIDKDTSQISYANDEMKKILLGTDESNEP